MSVVYALFILVIVPFVGLIFSTSAGRGLRISRSYQGFTTGIVTGDETVRLSKVAFWILYPNVLAVASYLLLYLSDAAPSRAAIATIPVFWLELLIWLSILRRLSLVNWKLYIAEVIISHLIGIWFCATLFHLKPSELIPEQNDLVMQFWLLVAGFLITVVTDLSESPFDSEKKLENYWVKNARSIINKHFLDEGIQRGTDLWYLILAILVKENYERPPMFRKLETYYGKTTGIGQVSVKNLSDEESIKMSVELISTYYNDYLTRLDEGTYSDWEMVRDVAEKYNPDEDYISDVSRVFFRLKQSKNIQIKD